MTSAGPDSTSSASLAARRPYRATSPARGQARTDAILAAAAALVVERGYDGVTVADIAARAGASKATLYRHWPDKAALIAEALRRHAEGPGPAPVADTGSLRGDLVRQVGAIARVVARDDAPSLLRLLEAVRDDPSLRDLVRAQIESASDHVARVLTGQAAARGEHYAERRVAAALRVAVGQVLTAALLTGRMPTPQARRRLVDEVLMPMLGPHAPSHRE